MLNRPLLPYPAAALAHLGFQCQLPSTALRPWIQYYWSTQAAAVVPLSAQRLYPSGAARLMLGFDRSALDALSQRARPELSLTLSQSLGWMLPGHQALALGISFAPGGFFAVFGLPPEQTDLESLGRQTDLEALLASLHQAPVDAHFSLLDAWLVRHRRAEVGESLFRFQAALASYLSSPLRLPVWLEQQGLARRQFERRCQRQIGVSPARLKQWQRIAWARKQLQQASSLSLTELALDAGFYDQAHFIHVFAEVTGQTPGDYRRRKMSQIYKASMG